MKNGRSLIIHNTTLSKDQPIYPSIIKGLKHNYLISEKNAEYIHIVRKENEYSPFKTSFDLHNAIFGSNPNKAIKDSIVYNTYDRLSNQKTTIDNSTKSLFNQYLSNGKSRGYTGKKQSLWYFDFKNKRESGNIVKTINKNNKLNNSTIERKKDPIINRITRYNNCNTLGQSHQNKIRLSNQSRQRSYLIENGLPSLEKTKNEREKKLVLKKQSFTIDNNTMNKTNISFTECNLKDSVLFNNTLFDFNDLNKKKINNKHIRDQNEFQKKFNTLINGINKINSINQETIKDDRRFGDNIITNYKTKNEEDIDHTNTNNNNNHDYTYNQIIKDESTIVKSDDSKKNKIEKVIVIKEAAKYIPYIKKMKFLTQFYNQREGEIRKTTHNIKHRLLKQYKSEISLSNKISMCNTGTKKESIFLEKHILKHKMLLNDNIDKQRESESMEEELIISLKEKKTIPLKCFWKMDYINKTYFDIHHSILNNYPQTTTKHSTNKSIYLFNQSIQNTTLLYNFNTDITQTQKRARKEDALTEFESNISLEDKNYINAFIVRHIAKSKIDDSKTKMNFMKKVSCEIIQNPLNTFKAFKYYTQPNFSPSPKRSSQRANMKLYEIAVDAIKNLTPEPQKKQKRTFEEVENDIINANILKNQDFFSLPFQKQRIVKFKRKKLVEVLYAQSKNYLKSGKAKKEYLKMKKEGFEDLTLNALNTANSVNQYSQSKSFRKTLFDMAYNNDTENFIKQMKTLNKNEYINDQDNSGNTLLAIAAKNSNIAIVKYLLEMRANPNIVNKTKDSPLHFALSSRNFKIANLLMTYNANENVLNDEGFTPWEYMYRDCLSHEGK